MEIAAIQAFMRERGIDGWLVYDFRGSNAVLWRLLGGKRWTTRRVLLHIPASGEPRLLVHGIDAGHMEGLPAKLERYLTWQEFRAWVAGIVAGSGGGRIAMEYSAGGMLPVVSVADAGTVEMVRAAGAEVVSSADVMQVAAAVWSPGAVERHRWASERVGAIKDDAFAYIRERLAGGKRVTEVDVAKRIREGFSREGLEFPDGPVVAANAHAGDPHYEPVEATDAEIKRGDWVLIDLWARSPGEEHIFADITWVAYAGASVPTKMREAFEAVKRARDAALSLAQERWRTGVQGWELDEASQRELVRAGYAEFVRHRTGHSLSPGPLVHGLGMNLDNLETHDTRRMLAGTGFTIEPGVYLPEFGVRLEINVYVDPQRGPVVTSGVQGDVVLV